jgi:hypothetical protein
LQQGAAPDDPVEFASFIGMLAEHLVERYGLAVVSKWRFRLVRKLNPSTQPFAAAAAQSRS